MSRIEIVSASAGSGKTYRLVAVLHEALTQGGTRVRPEAVVATTFTVKAAAELRERVRLRLLEEGLHGEAQRLALAPIGTVNSVCAGLVSEFAFELGLSPGMRALEEEAATEAFERALAKRIAIVRGEDGEVAGGSGPALALHMLERRLPGLDWMGDVRAIADQARANGILASDLPACAEESLATLRVHLGPADDEGAPLEQALLQALSDFVASPKLDETKATAGVVDRSRRLIDLMQGGRPHVWREWIAAAAQMKNIGSKSRALYQPVVDAATAVVRHPALHADLETSVREVFALAELALEDYRDYKRTWGLLDFNDQERLTLELLRMPEVREQLRERIDLVLVDEFQDTSPLQLELFLALADLAPRSVWVGDQKQAIYGFRGTDPALMDAAVAAIEARDPDAVDTLRHSWRSRAPLVRLTSEVFARAFESQGIAGERVRLEPAPGTPEPDALGPVVEQWTLLTTGRGKDEQTDAVAHGVRQLLDDATVVVRDPVRRGETRRPSAGDIAILTRSNNDARRIAKSLARIGIPAVLGRAGLIETLEARVALAALRLWVDGGDTHAAAELGRIVGMPSDPQAWLARMLDPVPAPFAGLAEVKAIVEASAARTTVGVLSAFDAAVEAVGVREWCLRWGDAEQRLANLDALRALVVGYLERCGEDQETPTLSGFLAALEHIASEKKDAQAIPGGLDAVLVSTMHGAKGLEWPVTVVYLPDPPRPVEAFGVQVVSASREFDFRSPLAGRRIRYWPDPFVAEVGPYGQSGKGPDSPLRRSIEQDAGFGETLARQQRERLRLLYVAWTRARDRIVFAGRQTKLLNGALADLVDAEGRPLLHELDADGTAQWAGHEFDARLRLVSQQPARPLSPEPGEGFVARAPREHPPVSVNPSKLQGEAEVVAREAVCKPVAVLGGIDPDQLGNACHAFLAGERASDDDAARVAAVERWLDAHGQSGTLRPSELAAAAVSLRKWIAQRWPDAVWHREWPLLHRLGSGSELHGFADLVLETAAGFVVVDHKCMGGSVESVLERACGYGGQLAAYAAAIEAATGRPVLERWLHLPMQGLCVRLSETVTVSSSGSSRS